MVAELVAMNDNGNMRSSHIPSWDGDAAKFEEYCEEARWYQASLKKEERQLAVARLRPKLVGPAKRVAKKMSVKDFEKPESLEKFLKLLAKSPLGKQPLPDAFQRIDKYDNLIRMKGEVHAGLPGERRRHLHGLVGFPEKGS